MVKPEGFQPPIALPFIKSDKTLVETHCELVHLTLCIHFWETTCISYSTTQLLAFIISSINSFIVKTVSLRLENVLSRLPPSPTLLLSTLLKQSSKSSPAAASWCHRSCKMCPVHPICPCLELDVQGLGSWGASHAVWKEASEAVARRGELWLGMCLCSCFQKGKLWSASKNPAACVPFDKKDVRYKYENILKY